MSFLYKLFSNIQKSTFVTFFVYTIIVWIIKINGVYPRYTFIPSSHFEKYHSTIKFQERGDNHNAHSYISQENRNIDSQVLVHLNTALDIETYRRNTLLEFKEFMNSENSSFGRNISQIIRYQNHSNTKYAELMTSKIIAFGVASLIINSSFVFAALLRTTIQTFDLSIGFQAPMLLYGILMGVLSRMYGKYLLTSLPLRQFHNMYFAAVPIILYRMCLYANLHGIKQNFLQILVISGPGFVMNAIMVGVTISFFLAREWSIIASLIFGSACVSIYPRENIERLRQLGHQPQHIAILLEGEAIFGTLAAFVLYNVMPSGHFIFQLASYREVFYILRYFIGGVIVGFILGKINCFFFWNMSSSIPNTLLISTTIPLTAFYLCTDIISVSGLIAISICGLMMDSEGVVLDQSSKILLREYWQIISIVLDAVILTVIGYVMGWNLVWSSNYLDYVYMVLTYCATLFGRCLTYIFAAPLTSRVGYGMDFRGMIVAIWAGSPSLINICYTILPWNIDERTEQILPVLSFYVSGMIVISLFLNMLSMPRLLTFLKMDIILPYRQNQLALCVRHLNKVRRRALMSMKIESLMGETDWKTAGKVPTLANPYDLEPRNDELNEDFQYIGYCPDCNQEIHLPPSHTEYPKLKESASIRVLKTRETLQIEMFSKGLISKTSFKILSGITRKAYDHPKNQMQVDGLLKMFRIENCCKKFEKILSFTCRKHAFSTRPPNYYWRRLSYHMMRSTVFHIIVFGVLFHNMVLIVTETCINPKPYANEKIAFTFFDAVFLMFYSFEFLVKVAGLSTKNFWKDGVKNYFRSTINILNFILLITVIMSFLSETLCYINRNSQEFLYVNRPWFATLKSLRMLRLFEFCKYIRLLVKKCLEIHRNKRLLTAYDASKDFFIQELKILDILPLLCNDYHLRKEFQVEIEKTLFYVVQELQHVQKDYPWVAMTIKTKYAVKVVIDFMVDIVDNLMISGWIDNNEEAVLISRLSSLLTKLKHQARVEANDPEIIFGNVPWIRNFPRTKEFLFKRAEISTFDCGEYIYQVGDKSKGIYIIITGVCDISYVPNEEKINRLQQFGELPIVDNLSFPDFETIMTDNYVVSGMTLGELGFLTGRPYASSIITDSPCKAYFLASAVLNEAMEMDSDPDDGLECRIWKNVSRKVATSLMFDESKFLPEKIETQKEKILTKFYMPVPQCEPYVLKDFIQDVVLIEGIIKDAKTQTVYQAPCKIPRNVQEIAFPENDVLARLLFVPWREFHLCDITFQVKNMDEV